MTIYLWFEDLSGAVLLESGGLLVLEYTENDNTTAPVLNRDSVLNVGNMGNYIVGKDRADSIFLGESNRVIAVGGQVRIFVAEND